MGDPRAASVRDPATHAQHASVVDLAGDVVREPVAAIKPRLRGWLHAGVSPVVLAAGIVLVCLAPTSGARLAAAVYATAASVLFVTSGVYNVGTWRPRVEAVLRRVDHANIYLIIAGTYTPIAVLALDGWPGDALVVAVWAGAGLGVLFRVVWLDAPRVLYTTLYIVLGWAVAPFVGDLFAADTAVGILTLAGGVLYTAGAVVYAAKRPDPNPTWFGFHEIFHVFTIGAWACQYVAVSLLVYRA